MNRRQQRILRALQAGSPVTTRQLLVHAKVPATGKSYGMTTIRNDISKLRAAGYDIRFELGGYRLERPQHVTEGETTHGI